MHYMGLLLFADQSTVPFSFFFFSGLPNEILKTKELVEGIMTDLII